MYRLPVAQRTLFPGDLEKKADVMVADLNPRLIWKIVGDSG